MNGGEGWDGRAYISWAKDFRTEVFNHGVTPLQSQRILPSLVVYGATGLAGVERTTPHAILAFQLLDALMLLVTALLVSSIARHLRWSAAATWAGYLATFLSFGNARHALYYPNLTDVTAYALGTACVWAYLTHRPVAQWIVALASAFTWPALTPIALTALVLPAPVSELPEYAGRWRRPLAYAVGLGILALVCAWMIEEIYRPVPGTDLWLERSHKELWPLTIACVAGWCAAAAFVVARQGRTWSLWPYARSTGWRRIALGLVAAAAVIVIRHAWIGAVGQGRSEGLREMQHLYAALALRGPLWNLVHHVVYFGPVVVVAILHWHRVARVAASWGPAIVFGVTGLVAIGVTTESRQLDHVIPLLVALTITATEAIWTRRTVLVFAACSVVWSKIWLVIGYEAHHDSFAWPDLRYMMQQGPWASDTTFLVHLAAAVVTAVVLVVTSRPDDAARAPAAPTV